MRFTSLLLVCMGLAQLLQAADLDLPDPEASGASATAPSKLKPVPYTGDSHRLYMESIRHGRAIMAFKKTLTDEEDLNIWELSNPGQQLNWAIMGNKPYADLNAAKAACQSAAMLRPAAVTSPSSPPPAKLPPRVLLPPPPPPPGKLISPPPFKIPPPPASALSRSGDEQKAAAGIQQPSASEVRNHQLLYEREKLSNQIQSKQYMSRHEHESGIDYQKEIEDLYNKLQVVNDELGK